MAWSGRTGPFQIPNDKKAPPPWYPAGEVKLGNLSQHAKMTPVPGKGLPARPGHPTWLPSVKPPEPWRDPEREPDFLGLAEPYRNNQEPDDGGRLGGEFVYRDMEGSEPGKPPGQCLIC